MGQWKEESPQHQSIIRNTNGIRDLCSVNPTSIYTGVNDNGGNVQHTFGSRLFLSEEKAEEIRKTMLSQEETFKEQIQALHKIYDMHRSAMHEIRRVSCSAPNLSTFSTTALHLQGDPSKCSNAKADLRHISPYKQAENHTISIKIPRSPTCVTLQSERSAQSSLKEVDKNAINSAGTKKKVRKTIDLERPPEEYLDDLDDLPENQVKETREVEKPDQVSVTSGEVSNTDQRFVGNENINITTQMAEKFAREREWSRTDIGRPLEGNNLESMSFKRLRGSRDHVDFLTDVKPAITIDQENSSPGLECKVEMGSSLWDNNKNDQVLHGKKKWFFDVDHTDKPSAMNTKPPPCFIQAPRTSKNSPENDSSQKTSWMLAPVLPRGWNSGCSSEDSFVQEQAIISSSKDAKLSSNMQTMNKKSINKETQTCGHPGSRQENLMTHPKQPFQTILATHPYGGASHLTPVVFTQGYSVGAAFPALGLQLSVEGHPAVAAQGFVFPAVNKNTEEGSGPKPLPAAWCPQGTYVQFYPYQQQVIQDNRFSTPCPSADQRSMLNGGQIGSFTPQKSRSQTEHSMSMQAQTQQCRDQSSSVNGPARFPRSQYFSIPSPRQPTGIHIKPVENDSRILGCTLDSRESQICTQKEERNSSTRNYQFGNPSDTEEERQVHTKVSICNDSFLGTQAMEGQEHAEGRRDCKYELQATEAISSKQTTWSRASVDESKMKDAGRSNSLHSCEGNCYLERIDTPHSAGQAVSQDLKELHVLANKMCFCKTSDIHEHASEKNLSTGFKANGMQSQLSGLSNVEDGMSIDASQKKHWVSGDKDQNCTSKTPFLKEHTKTEDLDSSGHGSNNIGTQEEKQCRGECAQHLDHTDTYTSFYSESKMAEEDNSQKVVLTDHIHKRTESVQIKESEDAMADDKDQPKAVYFQALSSSELQSQDVYCGMGEASINHVKDQVSPGNDPCDVKKDECGSGEIDKENTATVRSRQCDKNESLFDRQVNQQSSRIKQMQELQNDQPTIQRMPSSNKSEEAAKAHCQDLQENKGGSEEEEEASESLAAKILLSLAPSKSQVKGMSKESVTVKKQNAFQQRCQLACVASSSSHSSRDSTCHSIERCSAGRNKRRTHDTVMQEGAVGWTKSIRGKRRRTQRPRS